MADTAKNKTPDRTPDDVSEIADKLQMLADHAHELAQRLRAVRGTREPSNAVKARVVRQPVDEELYNRVRKMLETEPLRLGQLVEATGQHENKIKVLITKMQREGVHIVNLGAANKALWFIPSSKALERLENMVDED